MNFPKKPTPSNYDTQENPISHTHCELQKIVYEYGLDEESVIAALLHDVVEDTQISLAKIKETFGKEVELIVDGLTKITFYSGKNKKKEKKDVDTLRKILYASTKDIRILIIKLCDILHNMRTAKELPTQKRKDLATRALLTYVPIAQKIGIYSLKWELEDLAFKYTNQEMYQFIKRKLNIKRSEREKIANKAVEEIKEIINGENIRIINVLGRPKNFYSIYKKIKNKTKTFEEIHDLYAIRVIAKNITVCFWIGDVVF